MPDEVDLWLTAISVFLSTARVASRPSAKSSGDMTFADVNSSTAAINFLQGGSDGVSRTKPETLIIVNTLRALWQGKPCDSPSRRWESAGHE